MRTLYLLLLLLLPLLTTAQVSQTTDHGAICREGKIRSLNRQASNAKARLAYPGDESIDVTYYGLDLRLTHTPNSLTGIASITLKSTASSVSSFFLDLNSTTAVSGAGLHVDSVKANNQKLSFRHEQNKLTITPSQPLNNGQVMTLTVFYQGIPNTQTDFGSFVFGRHDSTTDPAIWTLSEPYGAPDWFPCKDSPADKADSSAVRITAPALFVSVSNGTLESTTNNPDGTRTYQWRNHYPIAQYLISIACTNYQRYDTPFSYGNQTLPIVHYIYPETLPVVKASLDQTPGIMRLLTDRFGPYPFLSEKYGHAQFGFNNGGMEHQTISSMEQRALTPGVIAHELAHQWFGDKITCRDWQNIWLNEGFASYAESIYAESVNGQIGYQASIASFMGFARNARGSIYVQDISNSGNIFNSDRTYAKGAVVLHMLRNIVGDSTFFRTLRTYAASPTVAYKSAVTDDFQAVAEQVSGQKLGYFFQQWIYGEGYPTYMATYATNGPTGGNVTVRLTQRNTVSTNPASFTMPVQIRVESAAGDTTVTVFNDRADQTFTLPARGPVRNITIDPNNRILKAVDPVSLVTAVDEPTTGGLRVYPNPTAETLSVDFTVPSAGLVTLALTTLTGQRVRQLSDANLTPGNYTRTLNLRGVSAGRYLVTITGPGGPLSRVVLVR